MRKPRLTVVTPSYNQGRFLEETLISVIGQGYPDLDYIVMDGGSTDESVALIEANAARLSHWQTGKDGGQAQAINAGFARATGDVLGWLNSDDHYLAGTLAFAASKLDPTKAEIVLGNTVRITEGSSLLWGTDVAGDHAVRELELIDYVNQPSSFWTRKAWDLVGPLDESLSFAFDWDWFIRAKRAGVRFHVESKYLSVYRLHDTHKTGTGGDRRLAEIASIYRRYKGETHVRAWEELVARYDRLQSVKSWVFRRPLRWAAAPVLRRLMPTTQSSLSDQEVIDIATMC